MTRELLYEYISENGVIISPVLLDGIQSIKKVRLIADDGKKLTKDNKNFASCVVVPVLDEENWKEVKK